MNRNTRKLHDLGQRLWLDNITRDLLDSGTLARYVADFSVTGLTSNPTIFARAISSGNAYDEAIRRLAAAGARPQQLLWASTGSKFPVARDTLYVEALAASDTINTIPEKTLLAFADHGKVSATMPAGGGYADAVLEGCRREGGEDEALATRLQREAVDAFSASWRELMARISEKSSHPATAASV